METLTIQVTQDHIDRIAKAKKPILGIAELIWNSVDADAKHVTGFTLREIPPGIQAPGYRFTAYLRSNLVQQMDEQGTVDMEEFGDLRKLLDSAKDQLRRHFLQRDAEKASGIVDSWKEQNIYPYEGNPKDVMEETERQIFDVVASSLDSYVSDFKDVKPKAKKLTFNLLRAALESNPSSLQFILGEVVGLPKDKQDEFAALLRKTSLMAMINASKVVTDRLDFLKGLEYVLYNKDAKLTPLFDEGADHFFINAGALVLVLAKAEETLLAYAVSQQAPGVVMLAFVMPDTGYVSNEGVAWIPVGSVNIPMAAIITVGLAVSNGNGSAASSTVFDNVQLGGTTGVAINQTLITLVPSQQAQLSATVTGTSNGAVTWSVSPPVGAITQGGLYTAPAISLLPEAVTVTATSQADPSKSASTVVQLAPFVPIRVNAGGPSTFDPNGVFWTSDTGASAGSTYSSGAPIANTTTPYLYQSEHFNTGSFSYSFYVPNGSYTVNLKFAEIFFTSPGQRVFTVVINGTTVLPNFDVVQTAGGRNAAVDKAFSVSVTNGQIVIQFNQITSNPKINAIEIM